MEREMWHLYEENYSEYREIVNVMHEEDSLVFNKHVIEDVSGDAALIQTSQQMLCHMTLLNIHMVSHAYDIV